MSAILDPNGTVERFLVLVVALAAVFGLVFKMWKALASITRKIDDWDTNTIDTKELKQSTDRNTRAIEHLTDIIQRNGLT